MHYPVGEAAAIEATGVGRRPARGAGGPAQRARSLAGLSRPLDAARCELLAGQRLLADDRAGGVLALQSAAQEYDELGVAHLAARARELAGQ